MLLLFVLVVWKVQTYHENINLHVCHSNHISFVSDLLKVFFYVENLKIKCVI